MHGDLHHLGVYCAEIARHWTSSHALYTLAPLIPSADDGTGTVEGLADAYLRLVREVQPTGPYHLVGHCNGGVVAFEMARRLAADGERVGLLCAMDANGVYAHLAWLTAIGDRAPRLRSLADRVRRALVRRVPHVLHLAPWRLALHLAARVPAVLRRRLSTPVTPTAPAPSAPPSPSSASYDAYAAVLRDYVPRGFPGTLVTVAARDSIVGSPASQTGWRRAARTVVEHEVAGTHTSMLTGEGAAAIAALLCAAIDAPATDRAGA